MILGAGARAGAVVAAALALGGCYKPNITNGGFLCATSGKQCPDGFQCGANGHCELMPTTVVTPPPQDTGADVSKMTSMNDGGGSEVACMPPLALCDQGPVGTDVCSPACQKGCACGRCNVVNGKAACVAAGTVGLGDVCNPNADDCAPGLICLLESCGNALARCYRLCTSDDQCSGTACTITVNDASNNPTKFLTCDVPPRTCDPVGNTGCPNPALNCYLTSANETLCDCPSSTQGGNDATCVLYNDCQPGFICIAGVEGQTSPHCHFVCNVAHPSCPTIGVTDGGQPISQTCMPAVVGAPYGYCATM